MLQYLAPVTPAAILLGGLFFYEFCGSAFIRRFTLWLTIAFTASRAIVLGSPYRSPLVNYITGFMASWYAIWAANLLLTKDVKSLRRIRKSAKHENVYIWEPLPTRYTISRLCWASDLAFNFRAVGWNFSKQTARHPPVLETDEQPECKKTGPEGSGSPETGVGRSTFLKEQMRRLFVVWLWLGVYTRLVHPTTLDPAVSAPIRDDVCSVGEDRCLGLRQITVLLDLWGVATTIYMFQDGIHAFAGLVTVGLFSSETWTYPPYFGPVRYLCSGRLQDIWGSFWHDLLKDGLQSAAKALLPRTQPRALFSLLRVWFCFCLTGIVHAAASYTASRQAMPSLHAAAFYGLQPVGIALQLLITTTVRNLLPKNRFSALIEKSINFAVGLGWLYYCFPWVSSDPALRQAIGAIRVI